MATVARSRNLIVTIGQSLNVAPDQNGPQSFYGLVKAHYAGVATVVQGHIGGIAWLQWKRTQDWYTWFSYWAPKGRPVIFSMLGGTTDYSTAANRTGAQCYADEGTISTNLRAAGPLVKIIGSTTNPSITFGLRTTVGAASDSVDVSTFAGAGTLTVADTANVQTGGTKTVKAQTSTGTATITYTGTTSTTLTGCTTTAGTGLLATGNWVRQINYANLYDGNALVLADASTYFDRIVDYASTPNLTDPTNTTYYADGTHPTALGQTLMFAAAQPAFDALLT